MVLLSTAIPNSDVLKDVKEVSSMTSEYGFGIVSFSILAFFLICYDILYK